MSTTTLFSYPNNNRYLKSVVAARIGKVSGFPEQPAEGFVMGKSNQTPEFHALNPFGQVPTLKVSDGKSDRGVFESRSILRYVAREAKEVKLYGADNIEASRVDGFLDALLTLDSYLPIINSKNADFLISRQWSIEFLNTAKYYVNKSLTGLERALQGKDWLVGNSITIADIDFFFTLLNAFKFTFDKAWRDTIPNIIKHFRKIEALADVQAVVKSTIEFKDVIHTPLFKGQPILVTGASGNIGARVARSLLERKSAEVIVGLRKTTGAAADDLRSSGAEIRQLDYDNKETLAPALRGVHTAYLVVSKAPNLEEQAKSFIDAAKKAGVKHIVRLTAGLADSKATASLAKNHGVIDDYLVASGISYTLIKPTYFHTNYLASLSTIKGQGAIYGHSGDTEWSSVDADDVADVSVAAIVFPTKFANQGIELSTEAHNSAGYAAILSKAVGKEIKFVDIPKEAYAGALKKAGVPDFFVEDLVFLDLYKRDGFAKKIAPDVIKQILGKEPRTFAQWADANQDLFRPNKILVSGASGNIGPRVVRHLLAQQADVVVGFRNIEAPAAQELKKQGAEVRHLDYDKKEVLEAALKGIDTAYLVLALVPNLKEQGLAFIAAAKAAGVKHIVRLSAGLADSKATDFPLAHLHGVVDDALVASGIDYTILAPTYFHTNFLNSAPTIKSQGAAYGCSGTGQWSSVDNEDLAEVSATISVHPSKHRGQKYLLSTEANNTSGYLAVISKAIGKEIKNVDLPAEAYAGSLKSHGLPEFLVTALVGLENLKKSGAACETAHTVIKQLLGKEPRTFAQWVEANKAAFI